MVWAKDIYKLLFNYVSKFQWRIETDSRRTELSRFKILSLRVLINKYVPRYHALYIYINIYNEIM